MEQRERQAAGVERLHRQAHHHRRVLADRVEHHRVLELGRDLANDVDALGFELPEVGQAVSAHAERMRSPARAVVAHGAHDGDGRHCCRGGRCGRGRAASGADDSRHDPRIAGHSDNNSRVSLWADASTRDGTRGVAALLAVPRADARSGRYRCSACSTASTRPLDAFPLRRRSARARGVAGDCRAPDVARSRWCCASPRGAPSRSSRRRPAWQDTSGWFAGGTVVGLQRPPAHDHLDLRAAPAAVREDVDPARLARTPSPCRSTVRCTGPTRCARPPRRG